jgi:hypothetical protein
MSFVSIKRFAVEEDLSCMVAHQLTARKNEKTMVGFKPELKQYKRRRYFADKTDNVMYVWDLRALDFKDLMCFGSQRLKQKVSWYSRCKRDNFYIKSKDIILTGFHLSLF